jgi:hypothetical protein
MALECHEVRMFLTILFYFHQDKILQSLGQNCDIQVTNDGATILKSISIDNPAAKVLVGN